MAKTILIADDEVDFRYIGRFRKSSSFSTTPVILISFVIKDEKLYSSLNQECPSCFMTKPIDGKVLQETVEELLKKGE